MPEFTGTPGDDTLSGSAGADTLIGLTGNDTYIVNDSGDVVVEAIGEGIDAIYSSVSYILGAGTEVEALSTLDWNSTASLNLTGNEIANWLIGNAGVNVLNGGAGADILQGRGGNDVYIVDNAGDAVFENAGEGIDAIYSSVSYILGAGTEVEALSTLDWNSTASLNLTGNEIANWLIGNAGVNILNGGAGADILQGRGGNDVYIVDNAGDAVFENAGEGSDGVYTTVSYTLGAGTDVETLSTLDWNSTASLNLTGNEIANWLIGNAGANQLRAGGGADIIEGKLGDDTLDGGAGADYLVGGQGNDVYIVDNALDTAVEAAGEGSDGIYTSVSYVLGDGTEVETLSTLDWNGTASLNLTGNNLANWLIGNAGSNVLSGGAGNDILQGRGGNDVYIVDSAGDLILEVAGEGSDAIYTSASYVLNDAYEVETLSTLDWNATTAINLTGNSGANWLIGNAGANLLDGKGGNDILQGRGGADTFAFTTALGAGNVDTVIDFSAGTDKIRLGGSAGEPFSTLASGTLAAGAFVAGSVALQPDDIIIYNSTTGAILYDADGNGAGAAVQFATLSTGLSLTAADFIVSGPANNPPAITSGGAASVAENSAASTIVYQTAATDADGDRITYSLSGADAALLNIDAVTGAVRLNSSPDFETKAIYSFNVVASDSGTSPSKAVTLTISDVADASTPIINEVAAPNDSTGTAQFIDRSTFVVASNPNLPDASLPSATIVGNLPDFADKDFFSITLQAGEKLILDVDNSGGNLDSHVRVYDAGGQQIGANDDPGPYDPGSPPKPGYDHNVDSLFSFRAPTAGTYYFSIEPFQDAQHPTSGSYQLNVSIGPVATMAQIIEEDIQALISGSQWPTTSITYSFPNSSGDYANPFGDDEPATFQPFSGAQPPAVQQMLQHISNVSLLTFQQLFDPNDGNAKLRYAMTNATGAAHAYLPGNSDEAGSAWFNKEDFFTPQKGNYAWMGILHETGHTLGLKHGHEPPAVSPDRDSLEYTVMTYRSFPGQDISGEGGYTNEMWGYPQSLMMYDIAALQKIYGGANYAFNSGNSVYSWNQDTGEMSINGAGQGAPGSGAGGTQNRIFMTIWDGGGNDTYDLSNYTSGQTTGTTIDLRPGEWTTISQTQIANLGMGHFARGNVANALLFQGDTRSLIENAVGSETTDTIIANQAANRLTGGGGTDTFTWKASTDAGVGALADTIMDFISGTDKIDLSGVDANSGTAGDDAFTFIGTGAFTGIAGQLRYDVTGGHSHIFADRDGNGIADMEIVVNNITTLSASDFFF